MFDQKLEFSVYFIHYAKRGSASEALQGTTKAPLIYSTHVQQPYTFLALVLGRTQVYEVSGTILTCQMNKCFDANVN